MLLLGLGISAALGAAACEPLLAVPDTLQVAWVSPIARRARASSRLTVVRSADLRKWVQEQGRDPAAVLQGLGLVGRRGAVRRSYKVVIFDVSAPALCSAVGNGAVPSCADDGPGRPWGVRRSAWTACGYLRSTSDGERSLDVYSISWESASQQGFCVMPLERFLAEG